MNKNCLYHNLKFSPFGFRKIFVSKIFRYHYFHIFLSQIFIYKSKILQISLTSFYIENILNSNNIPFNIIKNIFDNISDSKIIQKHESFFYHNLIKMFETKISYFTNLLPFEYFISDNKIQNLLVLHSIHIWPQNNNFNLFFIKCGDFIHTIFKKQIIKSSHFDKKYFHTFIENTLIFDDICYDYFLRFNFPILIKYFDYIDFSKCKNPISFDNFSNSDKIFSNYPFLPETFKHFISKIYRNNNLMIENIQMYQNNTKNNSDFIDFFDKVFNKFGVDVCKILFKNNIPLKYYHLFPDFPINIELNFCELKKNPLLCSSFFPDFPITINKLIEFNNSDNPSFHVWSEQIFHLFNNDFSHHFLFNKLYLRFHNILYHIDNNFVNKFDNNIEMLAKFLVIFVNEKLPPVFTYDIFIQIFNNYFSKFHSVYKHRFINFFVECFSPKIINDCDSLSNDLIINIIIYYKIWLHPKFVECVIKKIGKFQNYIDSISIEHLQPDFREKWSQFLPNSGIVEYNEKNKKFYEHSQKFGVTLYFNNNKSHLIKVINSSYNLRPNSFIDKFKFNFHDFSDIHLKFYGFGSDNLIIN